MIPLGAMILSGGASRRMGADKAQLDWHGLRAVDRVAELARAAGAAHVVTVSPVDYGLPRVAEATPFGGPVGGVVSGAAALAAIGCRRALVLAVDAPSLMLSDLQPLLAASFPGASYDKLYLPLVMYLQAIPQEAEACWPLAKFVERLGLDRLTPPAGSAPRLRGANDPDQRATLLAELATRGVDQKSGID